MTGVARSSGRPVHLRYRFDNAQREPVELWVSLPPDDAGQSVTYARLEPATAIRQCELDPVGLNRVAYLVIDPGEAVILSARIRPERRRLVDGDPTAVAASLPEDERRRYLRATPLVPTDGAIAEEAQRIVSGVGATDDHARAWALFSELATNYLYVYPPSHRGAAAMLDERAGDCGEFSFLFAAWCRSCDIPARTLVGTWARGKTQAHVWNEVHLGGMGWVTVDASMAALTCRAPWQIWLMGRRPGDWRRWFGALPADRIAFSIDPDAQLQPPFSPTPEGGQPDMQAAGQSLRWGRDTVAGAAPYLQPAYPRFESALAECADERWDDQEPLGRWRVLPASAPGVIALGLRVIGTALLVVGGVGELFVDDGGVGDLLPLAGLGAWISAYALRR